MRRQRQGGRLKQALAVPARGLIVGSGRGEVGQQRRDQVVGHIRPSQQGGLGERAAELAGGHRAEHHLAFLQRPEQPGVPDRVAVAVGPQRQQHQPLPGELAQRRDQGVALGPGGRQGEQALGVVHQDRGGPSGPAAGHAPGRGGRVAPRPARLAQVPAPGCGRGGRVLGDPRGQPGYPGHGQVVVGHPVAVAGLSCAQPRQQPGPQQRRLARAGRTDQHQRQTRALLGQERDQLGDVLPAEEALRVVLTERGEPKVRRRAAPLRALAAVPLLTRFPRIPWGLLHRHMFNHIHGTRVVHAIEFIDADLRPPGGNRGH